MNSTPLLCPEDRHAATVEYSSARDGVSVVFVAPSVLRRRQRPVGRAPAVREGTLPVDVSPSSRWGGVDGNEKAPRSDLSVEPGGRVSLFTHEGGQNDQL